MPQPGLSTNELYAATIDYASGPVKLMSATSYGRIRDSAIDDQSTPSWDVELGGRYSHNSQSFHELGSGLLAGNIDFSTASSEGVFPYSADARWKRTSAAMVYARIATGFAPGGPNDVIPGSTLPGSFQSSKTTNYEVGVKSRLLDGRLTAELTAFDIERSRIQLQAVMPGLIAVANARSAPSGGRRGCPRH